MGLKTMSNVSVGLLSHSLRLWLSQPELIFDIWSMIKIWWILNFLLIFTFAEFSWPSMTLYPSDNWCCHITTNFLYFYCHNARQHSHTMTTSAAPSQNGQRQTELPQINMFCRNCLHTHTQHNGIPDWFLCIKNIITKSNYLNH